MKTKFILLLMLLFSSSYVYSQIKIDESFDNKLIIIGNISSGAAMNLLAYNGVGPALQEHRLYCRIFDDKVTYGIYVSTGNRLDDNFEFALGTDINKAKESINTILTFMKNSDTGKSIKVTDEDNRLIQIDYNNRAGIALTVVNNTDNAIICDKVVLTKKNLERALKLLDDKAEAKVQKAIEKSKQK